MDDRQNQNPLEESLRFSPIKECLKCAICLGLYKDPRALPCQHVFCNQCLQEWLKVNQKCPKCCVALEVSTPKFPVAIEIVGMIDGYEVYCVFISGTLHVLYSRSKVYNTN